MKTITITLSDQLTDILTQYVHAPEHQAISLTSDLVIQRALENLFVEQGYLSKPRRYLRIPPSPVGSGYSNTSLEHDLVLTENPMSNSN